MKIKTLTSSEIRAFRKKIYHFFSQRARQFPWRDTDNPYHILVSEIMLQQTQTERVSAKYRQFIELFPDFSSLSRAPLRRILAVWKGLGYNRRAIALKRIAKRVVGECNGTLPSSPDVLRTFPGIGEATAAEIAAFAYHVPTVFIETNIRRVFIHCFFPHDEAVRDREILPLVEQTLDRSDPRNWYYALMDYGAMLKKEARNPNRRSAHYQKQSPFHGSNRQIRGMILKALITERSLSEEELVEKTGKNEVQVRANLGRLQQEGFIREKGAKYSIA